MKGNEPWAVSGIFNGDDEAELGCLLFNNKIVENNIGLVFVAVKMNYKKKTANSKINLARMQMSYIPIF